jgi:large subunit ribosomal protein L9
MLIILKKDVHNLGETGQIVKVRDGYGRNFLIPRGYALPAVESNVRVLEHQKRVAESIRRKEKEGAVTLAARISDMALTFRREAGDDKRLFGSVTNRDIAEALAAEGITIDRRQILLEDPIKSTGLSDVAIRLHRDITARLKVFVLAQQS